MRPPTRPIGVSLTRKPLASPIPHTMRSGLVGISFRCRFRTAPSGPISTTALYSVPRLNSPSRSWMPIETVTFSRRAAAWIGFRSPALRSTEFSINRR